MKKLFCVVSLLLLSINVVAQITPQWVRYPTISPNGETIAFTYKGDIYTVPAVGGQANRLTFHEAHDYHGVFSHDGQQIAFASNRFGNFDIFVMDARGGEAKRLTFHSSDEIPYTFTQTHNGNNPLVVFSGQRMDSAAHRQYPTNRLPELYSVPVAGGRVNQVSTIALEDVKISSSGNQLIYHDKKGGENQWRKHHKSAIARDIWTFDISTGQHKQITTFEGEDRSPIYTNNDQSFYYLSEQSGTFNIHLADINNPTQSQQLTDFALHPVRFLSKGQQNGKDILAFSYHGILHTMVPGETAKPVAVTIHTQDTSNNVAAVNINGDISTMAISPDGKQIAYISNGEVFVSSNDGAFTKQITHTPSQENFVTFSPTGDYLLYAAHRDNKWSIFKATKVRKEEPFFYAATLIKEEALISNDADNYQPVVSPNGEKLAFIEDRRSLKILDLNSQKTTVLVTPENMLHMRDGDQTFSFSPDSEWILFEYNKLLNNADIAMVHVSGKEQMRVVIPSGYYDAYPKWVNNGKQIIWFSNRSGLKSYATSGLTQNDVYSLFLTQTHWDKFTLSEHDYALQQAIEEINTPAKANTQDSDASKTDETDVESADTPVEPINIQWNGLDDRIAKLTIHSSNLADAVLNKEADTLYYLASFEDKYNLWQTNLRTQETSIAIALNTPKGSLVWDPSMENLYLLSDGNISKLMLDDKKSEAVAIIGELSIDQNLLREQAFEHVWLRTAKVFYEPTYHGVDWVKMKNEYKPKVSHVANVHEFTNLLSEMLGELNVSHSGAGIRDNEKVGDDTASLGVFYDYTHWGDGVKVTEIINGGPLDKAVFALTPPLIITKIDGESITDSTDWTKMLNRKVDKFVLLDIQDTKTKQSKQITIKPISRKQESDLLYKRFVKINEKEVLEKSNGRLGYVHIPGMGDGPYRDIYNDMMGRFFDKEAMVVDTRFNSGGDLVADLATFFTGEAFLTYAIEGKVVGGEPTSRYTKPVITLFNEAMYSDGHCYASGFTDLKLGKSVGMPVPGTCSFAGWEKLPMGGYWGVVPISAKNIQGQWLENNQTPPNIEIKNEPGVIDAGRDQQLERTIQEMLQDL